jgi:uncharacterized RDD family membrane protein YckC
MILASRSSRVMAQVVDSFIAFVPFIAIMIIAESGVEALESLILPAFLLIPAYILFADALPGGQSYGKRMLGIAVVSKWNAAPCTAWQSFVRNVMLGIFGIIDWVFIFGEKQQRLGDMAADTIVVEAASIDAGVLYDGQETPRVAYGPYGR